MSYMKQKSNSPQNIRPADLSKYQSNDIYNSVGKSLLSGRPTAPAYGFTKQERDKWGKLFLSKEYAKVEFNGLSSPGPTYNVNSSFNYTSKNDAQVRIGNSVRQTLAYNKYDYYNREDSDYEPQDADISRRSNPPIARIGNEERFIEIEKKYGPGPKYLPNMKPELKNAPKYTFGLKANNSTSPLGLIVQTPKVVGPGTYMTGQVPNTSLQKNEPKWSFSKGSKFASQTGNWDKYQTYDTKSRSIGPQQNSRKLSLPLYSIGKSHRDAPSGYFKDQMVKVPRKLNLSHNY